MITPEQLKINRIVIHRVHKKDYENEFGFAEYSDNLFDFGFGLSALGTVV